MSQQETRDRTVDTATKSDLETVASIEAGSLARRAKFALGLTQAMGVGISIMTVLMVIVWLLATQYIQILLFAATLAQMVVCSWLYHILHRQDKVIIGFYIFCVSFLILIFVAPLLIPEIIVPASIGYVVLIPVGSLLLGKRDSRLLVGACIVAFAADIILINTISPDWFTLLDETARAVVSISISLIALIIATVMLRQIVQGQEEQFWQSQLANWEIKKRIIEEQEQRERLQQANLEIEQRADTEREQYNRLQNLTRQIRETANQLSTAATEIQTTIVEQTASAAEQNVAVTQTAAIVEEVRATVLQTAERAQAVADSAQESMEVSHSGQQAIADTMDGMTILQQKIEDIAGTILTLSERTQQIGEIIEVVNMLASQSKLLALNASIEAARAGEEGRGFAVVALEVRQLADQSREATSRVSDILNDIQNVTNTAVLVTEEGSKGAETGMALTERTSGAIRKLAATVEEAAQTSTLIAANTRQQSNGVEQLASAMLQIRQASTQIADAMKGTEQSVHDLMEMAAQLEEAATSH
ncbi:methyl-accepting chemotaxis protein [Chloroflexota bacterium]